MNEKIKPIGIYVHIPYCDAKCPYCDFYSVCTTASAKKYTDAVIERIETFSQKYNRTADTLYFGGGTPTLIGADNLCRIISAAKENFSIKKSPETEVTVETNPSRYSEELLGELNNAGVNRLSIGLQSAHDEELKALGRRHTPTDAALTVSAAKAAGINNISLDVMLGIPGQTDKSLAETLDFICSLKVTHISAYILKVEEKTVFAKLRRENKLILPDDEAVRKMYLDTVSQLEKYGYHQYEISNFALNGFESRHNLKYWNDCEYLGIGAAAHSFADGKRFYFDRSINGFCNGNEPVQDGSGGDFSEYAMLKLRLTDGLNNTDVLTRFGHPIPEKMLKKAGLFASHGLMNVSSEAISLTPEGFIVSNEILCELL